MADQAMSDFTFPSKSEDGQKGALGGVETNTSPAVSPRRPVPAPRKIKSPAVVNASKDDDPKSSPSSLVASAEAEISKGRPQPKDLPFDPFSQFVNDMSKQISTTVESKVSPSDQFAFLSPFPMPHKSDTKNVNEAFPSKDDDKEKHDSPEQTERPQIAKKPDTILNNVSPLDLNGLSSTTKQLEHKTPWTHEDKSKIKSPTSDNRRGFSSNSPEVQVANEANVKSNVENPKSPSLRLPNYLITPATETSSDHSEANQAPQQVTTDTESTPKLTQSLSISKEEFEDTGYHVNGACHVFLHLSDISKLHVDCVVIYTNDRLVHRDGASKAVAHKAGTSVLTACIAIINTSGTKSATEFVQTTSGNLPCKHVIHAVTPTKSTPSDQKGEAVYSSQLQQTFINVLKHTKEEGHCRVAATTTGFATSDNQVVAESWYKAINECFPSAQTSANQCEVHLIGSNPEILKLLVHFFRTDRRASPLTEVKIKIEEAKRQRTEVTEDTPDSQSSYENVELKPRDNKTNRQSNQNAKSGNFVENHEYMEFDPFQLQNTPKKATESKPTTISNPSIDKPTPSPRMKHQSNSSKSETNSISPPELPPRPANQQLLDPVESDSSRGKDGTQSTPEQNITKAKVLGSAGTKEQQMSVGINLRQRTPQQNLYKVGPNLNKTENVLGKSFDMPRPMSQKPADASSTQVQVKPKVSDARPKQYTPKVAENIYSDVTSQDTTYESIKDNHSFSPIDVSIPAPISTGMSFKEQHKMSWYNTERRQNIQNIGQESYNPNLPVGFIVGNIIQIYVHEHDITKLKLDAVVNPTNKELKTNSNTSKAIVKCAGAELVEECSHIRKSRVLHETEVIETSAWQLPYKHILHAVIPRWTEISKFRQNQLQLQYHNFLDDIKSTYENIFSYINKMGLKSVAISPLNLNIQSVPVEHISNAICDAIFSVVRSHTNDDGIGTLEVIHVVDLSPDTLIGFVNRLPKGSRKEVDKIKVTPVSVGAVYNAISIISDARSRAGGGPTHDKTRQLEMTNVYANSSDKNIATAPMDSSKPKTTVTKLSEPGVAGPATQETGARPKTAAASQGGRKQDFKACSFHIGKYFNVIMHICDITIMKVDAIVSPTSSQLESTSGVSKSIVKTAGPDMVQYCEEILQNQGLLQIGDVVLTPPGRLPCKVVFHSVAPKWPTSGKMEDQTNCLEKLRTMVEKILEEADQYGVASVAIPPLNSVVQRIPRRFMAETMIKAFVQFTQQGKREGSSVKDIHVVDSSPEVLILLMEDLEKTCKDGSLFISPANDITDVKIKESAVTNSDPDYSLPKPRTIPESPKVQEDKQVPVVQRENTRLSDRRDHKDENPKEMWRKSEPCEPTADDVTRSLPSLAPETTSPTGSFSARGYSLYDPNQLEGVNVYLHMNMITRISTDIIVNPTDRRLKHHKGLSRLVAEIGGAAMKAEGHKLIKHSKIPITGVVVTGPGQLPCKLVLHAVIPKWPTKDEASASTYNILTETCLQDMRVTFNNIFVKVNEIGTIKSLAIPLLSTVVPMEHMVEFTFQALLANCCIKSLETIHVVHVRPDLLKPLSAKLDRACDLPVRGLLVTRLESDVHQEVQSVVTSNTDLSNQDIYSEIPSESNTNKKSIKAKGAKALGRFVSYFSGTKRTKESNRPQSERHDSQRRYSVS